MAIKVLIAEDHAMVREGLRMVLESGDGISVVGEASNGRDAVNLVQKLNPDVIVMDISMPGLNGIEATTRIREICPTAKIIILSMHSSAEYVYKTLRAGALGYLLKESAGKELREAVRRTCEGRRYLCEEIEKVVVDGYISRRDTGIKADPFERLSSREREIIQMVVEGKTSAEIARVVCLSRKTVESYRSRGMRKLGARDVPNLVKMAISNGLTNL